MSICFALANPVKYCKFIKNMFYTYILKSNKDGKLYTGSTKNLQLRFEQHTNGKVVSTKYRRPLKLIYYEACVKEDDARCREKSLKSFRGKMFIRNRLKSYFTG
jgi:putative endonuclease